MHIFADDVQIYLCSNRLSISEIARLINLDLRNIYRWSERNLLPLNPEKSQILFMTRSCNNTVSPPSISLNNVPMKYVDKISNLGVIFQSHLEWDSHINSQCRKVYNGLRHLKLTANFLPTATKLKLFKTLLLPHLVYGSEFLLNASSRSLGRLRVAVNCCIRWMFNLSSYSSVSHLQPQLLGCSFSNFVKFRCFITLYKIINTAKPLYLHEKLQPFRSIRERNFRISRVRTSYYRNTLFVRGIVYWNQIPAQIKISRSINEFCRGCISWLNTSNQ